MGNLLQPLIYRPMEICINRTICVLETLLLQLFGVAKEDFLCPSISLAFLKCLNIFLKVTNVVQK